MEDNKCNLNNSKKYEFISYIGKRVYELAYELDYSCSEIRNELRDISFRIDRELLR